MFEAGRAPTPVLSSSPGVKSSAGLSALLSASSSSSGSDSASKGLHVFLFGRQRKRTDLNLCLFFFLLFPVRRGSFVGAASSAPVPRVCVSVSEADVKGTSDALFWKVKFDGQTLTSTSSSSGTWKETLTGTHAKDSLVVSLWSKKDAASLKLGSTSIALNDVVSAGSTRDEWLTLTGIDGKQADVRVHVVVRLAGSSESGDESGDASPRRMSLSVPNASPSGLTLRRDMSHLQEMLKGRPASVLEREKEYRKLFELPDTDLLVGDWAAAFMKGVARQGRLFVFSDHLCFYSNLFGVKTSLVVPFVDVIGIDKTVENLTPGIKVRTNSKSYNFGGLYSRVRAFEMISNIWKGSYVLVEDSVEASDGEAAVVAVEDESKSLEVGLEKKKNKTNKQIVKCFLLILFVM